MLNASCPGTRRTRRIDPYPSHAASGTTTSYHVGPGLEVFVGDHLAVGGDLRARIPNAGYVKAQVTDELSAAPVTGLLDVWQANLTVAYYL